MKANYPIMMFPAKLGSNCRLTPVEADWLASYRDSLIALLLSWCSDFSFQDAEEVVSDLFERIGRLGVTKTLGQMNEANLFFHLRREKENFRRRRGRIKRGGNAVQCDLADVKHEATLEINGEDSILTRSDYRLLDDYLQLIQIESNGRLKVVVLAMRRVFDCYQTPADLVEAMSADERKLFFPCDGRELNNQELECFILIAVNRTLEKLRQRLRELREVIPMN